MRARLLATARPAMPPSPRRGAARPAGKGSSVTVLAPCVSPANPLNRHPRAACHPPNSKKEGFHGAWLPVRVVRVTVGDAVEVEYCEIKEDDDDDAPLLREELSVTRCVLSSHAATAPRSPLR